jgi:hypothetical protein
MPDLEDILETLLPPTQQINGIGQLVLGTYRSDDILHWTHNGDPIRIDTVCDADSEVARHPTTFPMSTNSRHTTVAYPSPSYPPLMQSPYSLPHMVPSIRSPPILGSHSEPSSAPLPSPTSTMVPFPTPPNLSVKVCVYMGRTLVYPIVIFLCVLWIIWCFVFIMTGFCIVGCCTNFCANRSGRYHDLPVLCDGIERSTAYAVLGCNWLLSFTQPLGPHSD